MKFTKLFILTIACFFVCIQSLHAQSGLIISEILANPAGTDSPFEFVELTATQTIDFSVTPYTVIVSNNGTANVNGWITGNTLSYAFQINTGNVVKGDVVYVGGSSITVTGAKLRTINTVTTAGDGSIGNAQASGVFGNGGGNADGIAVFNLPVASIISSTVPIDAIFYGTAIGSALVSSGTAGYELPVNDLYSGGKLQSTSFLATDLASAVYLVATGTYNVTSHTFTTARTFACSSSFTDNTTSITLGGRDAEELLVSPSSLVFSTLINQSSEVKNYTLSGNMLTSDAVLTTEDPFELSLSATGPFTNAVNVAASEAMAGQTVYVRYHPITAGPHEGSIHHVSGLAEKDLELDGATLELISIYEIQGDAFSSTYINQLVVTEGIVTADFQAANQLKGFYLQDQDGDGNALTSDAIFVYDNLSSYHVAAGDKVRVYGTVKESFGRTQLESISSIAILSSGHELTPVVLPMPAIAALQSREAFEGMLIKIAVPLYVSENYNLARYGEVLLAADSFLVNPTNFIDLNDDPADGNTFSGTSNILSLKNRFKLDSLRSILLDDGSNVENPGLIPFIDAIDHTLRGGSSFQFNTGILDYAFGVYRIQPLDYSIEYAERPEVPQFETANIVAASMNVLNFFNGNGLGGGFPTSRGATNSNELMRQTEKIYAALYAMNADVVGLMEMENDGNSSSSAITQFSAGLNQYILLKTGMNGTYAVVADPSFIGTDEIKCAIIFKTDKLEIVGSSSSGTNPVFSRPPVAQVFHVLTTDKQFIFIVNHFKSKGCTEATGNDLDQNDGQSCYNEKRKNQAAALAAFIDATLTSTTTDKVLSVGDYNAYEQEDPIDALRASGFINLINHSYSFVFNGAAGSLDHAFVNAEMESHVTGAEKWHINAAEPRALDYNTEFNLAYVYQANAFRSSDHDPLLVGLEFTATVTGIEDGEATAALKIYPNPTESVVHLAGTNQGDVIKVRDNLGHVVWQGIADHQLTSLDLSALLSGIYTVECKEKHYKMVKK
ncbi:MAG: ExeM/NucH family extracellular endonuclease [Cytophagaceae bacterium]|nr:ExeM/NucH family extracellular endonuclease [Cytophagaceae bacterium]